MLPLPSLSIVIPAFNEASTIEATVRDAIRVGHDVTDHLEVIVCNDGSSDATGQILRELGDTVAPTSSAPTFSELRVIGRLRNRGIEASMRALYAAARHDWIFLNSADRQWPMSCLVDLVAAAEVQRADFVIGVRSNKREVYTPYRRLISWSYERVVRMLGAPGGDPGSIKLARRDLLHTALAARGVFAEGERVIRAARAGARIIEVPVEFHRRGAGKATGARMPVVATAALDVVRVAASLVLRVPAPTLPDPEADKDSR